MSERYITWIDGEEATVELFEGADGAIRARIEPAEGEPREVTFQQLDSGADAGRFQLTLPDGRSVQGRLTPPGKGNRILTTGDHRLQVQAISERDAWMGDGGVAQDESEVTVSMPGKVIKALVAVGDAVEQGQPVLIIEAMKMENEVKAGRSGVVTVDQLRESRNGLVLVNAGHGNDEIDIASIKANATTVDHVADLVVRYGLEDGPTLVLLADGNPLNIVTNMGSPEPVLLHFAVLGLTLEWLAGRRLEPGETPVPPALENEAATLALQALGMAHG